MILKFYSNKNIFIILYIFFILCTGNIFAQNTTKNIKLPYHFTTQTGRLYLQNPKNIKQEIKYNFETGDIIILEKINDYLLSYPKYKTSKEYSDELVRQQIKLYFRQKNDAVIRKKKYVRRKKTSLLPEFQFKNKLFENIFGGNTIDIKPKGFIYLNLGKFYQYIENPQIYQENRGLWNIDFDQRINLKISGMIGTKVPINFSYDTKAFFDFENIFKIDYQGKQDDIIKNLKLGNVEMKVNNSLIRGYKSLFGVKLNFQLGRFTFSSVISQQKSQTKSVSTEGGGTITNFEFRATDYESDKHFFLAQYFLENYDKTLQKYPFIDSEINITRVEVWKTNRAMEVKDTRNILAITDLGEDYKNSKNSLPNNDNNPILKLSNVGKNLRDRMQAKNILTDLGIIGSTAFVQLENAKKLTDRDFKFYPKLGYISLTSALSNDEVLAVAFQYTYRGEIYQVGEFSTDGVKSTENLVLKMIKSNVIDTSKPIWNLMMKNIYSLNIFGLKKEDFVLNILYEDAKIGKPINYFTEGNLKDKILLQVFNLDRLSKNGEAKADGYFDFQPNITINSEKGIIIFTTVYPFGKYLESKFLNKVLAKKYVFNEVYEFTKNQAEQKSRLNKFLIKGKYKSDSGGEISLGTINVPRGSVRVNSIGKILKEGVDYIVDYQMGTVKIINESILVSNTPVNISLENNSIFGIQTKTFMGFNLAYKFSDDLIFEGTLINLTEKPLTQKMNFGEEYINNTIMGLNAKYAIEVPFLTDFADIITFSQMKSPSNFSVNGEFAYFIPGINGAVDERSYIDDFEGTQSSFSMKAQIQWHLASTPSGTGQNDFTQANVEGLDANNNRAKLAWYTIDPLFYRETSRTPKHILNDKTTISKNEVRPIYFQEIFPTRDLIPGQVNNISTLDLAYYPSERGAYNLDATAINNLGELTNPQYRWGGIMRALTTTNFERSNIEYIQFWLLDPFDGNLSHRGGDLYFHLGNISEDVLKDSRKSFENGLPKNGGNEKTVITDVAKIPEEQSLVYSFTNSNIDRKNQDVGLDGLSDEYEKKFAAYKKYLNKLPLSIRAKISEDPAGDNFKYFRSSEFDRLETPILERYKNFNGVEGNSPTNSMSKESYPTFATKRPDTEDIDQDQILNNSENYFQYKFSIKPNMKIGMQKYLTDIRTSTITLPDGNKKQSKWYQFKIPIYSFQKRIGGINNFTNIRFFRIALKNFYEPVVLRFATLDFIRVEWKRYKKDLKDEDSDKDITSSKTSFDINAINFEENENRKPIPYKLPNDVRREQIYNKNNLQKQNEQSLSLRIDNLEQGDSRAVYKFSNIDLRRYKKMNMYIHAEAFSTSKTLNDDELYFFIRLGSDQSLNYYEYKIPLKVTAYGVTTPDEIWPKLNELDIDIRLFEKVKLARNKAFKNKSHSSILKRYTIKEGDREITIRGNPLNSRVEILVMGIQNPEHLKQGEKSVEVWFNDLYLYDFDRKVGWATNISVRTNLSDFADLSFDGSISTIGFGDLNKKINDQSIEDIKQYNFATTVNIDKIFPKNWRLKIPIYYSISEQFKTPEFNPFANDLQMGKSLENENIQYIEKIKNLSQDYIKRMSINFVNVKKIRNPKSVAYPWDIENLSFSYSHNEILKRNIDIEYNMRITNKASLTYRYAFSKSNVKLFNFDFLSDKYFDFFKKINFNYLPNNFSFQTDFNKNYETEKFRNLENPHLKFNDNFKKDFKINWKTNFYYDITNRLKLYYSSQSNGIIDEYSDNEINPETGQVYTQYEMNKYMWKNILNFGRPKNFHHKITANYNIPTDELPFIKCIKTNYSYSVDYDWSTPSLELYNKIGNTIQNNNSHRLTTNIIFNKLYSGFDFIKNSEKRMQNYYNKNRKISKIKQKSKKYDSLLKDISLGIFDHLLSVVMAVKNVNISYSQNNGMILPGYMPNKGMFGFINENGKIVPSFKFLLGDQEDIRTDAVANNWLIKVPAFNLSFQRTQFENLNINIVVEPLPQLKINFTGRRKYTKSQRELFRNTATTNAPVFRTENRVELGNFEISYLSLNTIFKDSHQIFDNMLSRRLQIANRLAEQEYKTKKFPVQKNGFPKGFSAQHQKVLFLSILSAYVDENSQTTVLEYFRKIPILGWNITYSGLSKLPFISDYFNSIILSQRYSSVYIISSFQANTEYKLGIYKQDKLGDFLEPQVLGALSIRERFSPLISVNLQLKKSLSLRLEFHKTRNIYFSFQNNKMNEVRNEEIRIGAGYRIRNFSWKWKMKKRWYKFNGDVNIKFNFSFKDSEMLIRDVETKSYEFTGGRKIIDVNSTIDYQMMQRLNLELYYEQNISGYILSTSFPTSSVRVGVIARINLD